MTTGKFNQGHLKSAKLTPSQVLELRQAYVQGATQGSLARRYRVSVGTIGRIVRGESWQSYDSPPDPLAEDHHETLGRMAVSQPSSTAEALKAQEQLKQFLAQTAQDDAQPRQDAVAEYLSKRPALTQDSRENLLDPEDRSKQENSDA